MTVLVQPYSPGACRVFALGLALSMGLCAPPVFAEDTGCKAVFEALLRVATTPYHLYGRSQSPVPGGKPQLSETINTGKARYLLIDGRWVISKLTSEQMAAFEEDTIKNNKTVCHLVRDESIDGVRATLYTVHEGQDANAIDEQLWISKLNGLPAHQTSQQGDYRYEYSDVAAPTVHRAE
jgi:hypothetical protein